jgi:hypothetical protein
MPEWHWILLFISESRSAWLWIFILIFKLFFFLKETAVWFKMANLITNYHVLETLGFCSNVWIKFMYFIIKFHLPLRVFVPFYMLSFHMSVF